MSESGQEGQGGSPKLSRRGFLGASAAAIAAAVVDRFLGGPTRVEEIKTEPKPSTFVPTVSPKPTPTEVPDQIENQIEKRLFGGMEFTFKNGLPLNCTFKGEIIKEFNQEDLLKARQNAITSQEPEISQIVEIPQEPKLNVEPFITKEHPLTPELPKDVVPENELREKYGITIIQPESTKLFIRRSAIEPGGILSYIDHLKTGHTITFALGDCPVISPRYFTDPKYDAVRSLLSAIEDDSPERLNQVRQELAKPEEDKLPLLRKQLLAAIAAGNSQESQRLQEEIMASKGKILLYRQLLSDSAIDLGTTKRYAGLAFSQKNTVIFLSVGKEEPNHSWIGIGFDAKGECQLVDLTYFPQYQYGDLTPLQQNTHPNPQNFPRQEVNNGIVPSLENGLNPYFAVNAGFLIWHETVHDFLIWGNVQKGNPEDRNEFRTDMRAIEEIGKAWKTWVESGYTDDSGYPFVFQLPNGNYILTRTESSKKLKTA